MQMAFNLDRNPMAINAALRASRINRQVQTLTSGQRKLCRRIIIVLDELCGNMNGQIILGYFLILVTCGTTGILVFAKLYHSIVKVALQSFHLCVNHIDTPCLVYCWSSRHCRGARRRSQRAAV